MVDPRGGAPTIGSGAQSPSSMPCASACSCSTVRSAPGCRATTSAPTISADDALEGCNEHLVLTRPDLVSQMHAEFFDVGVDAVETATFGAFPLVLNEYQIAGQDLRDQPAGGADRPGGRVLRTRPRTGRVSSSARSAPARSCRRSATFATTELRDDYEAQVDGLLAGGVDVLLVETVYDLLQAKAAINGARRRDGRSRRAAPDHGAGDGRDDGPHARRHRDRRRAVTALEAMQPDVIGMNCATGPAEMTEHLRYLAQHASNVLVVPSERGTCRRSSTATPTTT